MSIQNKESKNVINVPIRYNGIDDSIEIDKESTIIQLKQKIIEKNKLKIEPKDSRIIIKDRYNVKVLFVENDLEKYDNMKISSFFIDGNNKINLQIKNPGEKFEDFDLNDTFIYVLKWNDSYKNGIDKKDFIKIKINKRMNYDEVSKLIKDNLKIPAEKKILIFKKKEYSVNNYSLIEYKSDSIGKEFFNDGMVKLYIEENVKLDDSKFSKLFENQTPKIKVIFNNPIPESELAKKKKITIKDYKFNNKIEINPKRKINELKEEISKIINVPIEKFIIKKNSHNGNQIRKMDSLIINYGSNCLTLYVQLVK